MDIILFNKDVNSAELNTDLKFDKDSDLKTRNAVTEIVKDYYDCFATRGAKRTILGYKFGINTAGPKYVCCWKHLYGHYESNVIL